MRGDWRVEVVSVVDGDFGDRVSKLQEVPEKKSSFQLLNFAHWVRVLRCGLFYIALTPFWTHSI